ncbi:hypothetical protein QE152_g37716 [Popillia japonica]|uniref:Uncharacterized protein n=1 Tax=Popillia japonica TaxID=7064 RepID=A0AAW1I9A0_POPJA
MLWGRRHKAASMECSYALKGVFKCGLCNRTVPTSLLYEFNCELSCINSIPRQWDLAIMNVVELLEELECPDEIPIPPDEIILFSPENANNGITDSDIGDAELATLINFPKSQLGNDVGTLGAPT